MGFLLFVNTELVYKVRDLSKTAAPPSGWQGSHFIGCLVSCLYLIPAHSVLSHRVGEIITHQHKLNRVPALRGPKPKYCSSKLIHMLVEGVIKTNVSEIADLHCNSSKDPEHQAKCCNLKVERHKLQHWQTVSSHCYRLKMCLWNIQQTNKWDCKCVASAYARGENGGWKWEKSELNEGKFRIPWAEHGVPDTAQRLRVTDSLSTQRHSGGQTMSKWWTHCMCDAAIKIHATGNNSFLLISHHRF